MRIIGYTYDADLYCADCGADLPDVDTEGNDKGAVFTGAEFDSIPYCNACHQPLDGFTLTEDGVRHTVDFLAECAVRLNVGVGDDALEDALRALQPYGQYLTVGERCLIEAIYAGEEGDAYAIAKYYRAVDGDDLIYLPLPLQAYWPYL
ncbi:hypothetical protein [Dokdonella sp.]|uniref:hypothetical protein n=1 Tax=Dokdonella sp. TaxID=2291710 RepID=UPI0031CBCE59|nr:hypothetical protein [Dokdonella sp.]